MYNDENDQSFQEININIYRFSINEIAPLPQYLGVHSDKRKVFTSKVKFKKLSLALC